MEQLKLSIDGMTCGHCVAQVTKALKAVSGVNVEQVTIGEATVSFDPTRTSEEGLTEAVESQGYSVTAKTLETQTKIER